MSSSANCSSAKRVISAGEDTGGTDAMSMDATDISTPARSYLAHAKLIGLLTLVSRVLGMARDIVLAHYLGAGSVASSFRVAFSIPNLFRKLFGEGALSAAFIPLYSQSLKHEGHVAANEFAAAGVTLLGIALILLTVIGEGLLAALVFFWSPRAELLLTLKLAAIMLPYVLLICGTAFLGAILQVHRRFAAPAAAPILLNVVHIAVAITGARLLHLQFASGTQVLEKQTILAHWLAAFVLVAGVLQVLSLWPALRASGFAWRPGRLWTPAVARMLRLTVPVALGAGVLQLSVFLDKSIALALAQPVDGGQSFRLLGRVLSWPMETGAAARLDIAQSLYQFPLGVFAIALATAIFPGLSADAMDKDRGRFRAVLRQGIDASLFEGFAASAGLMLVSQPAIHLMFRHGHTSGHEADLIGRSLMFYASGIWAFSLLQIINRAYYALHDTRTPFVMSIVNIFINLAVELPLLWTPLAESAMAVGTVASFSIQALFMLWMLQRRVGGLELGGRAAAAGKMLLATLAMISACLAIKMSPIYPVGEGRWVWSMQLGMLMLTGAAVYLAAARLLGLHMMRQLLHHP